MWGEAQEKGQPMASGERVTSRRALIQAGSVLGFGLGGFLDGIILHQLFQWHHLISQVTPPDNLDALELNTFWDGLFHMAMYAITLIGLILVWRAIFRHRAPNAPRTLFGAVLIGLGIFHTFDSVVNHWILQIHHIRMVENWLVYDIGYLLIGLIAAFIGLWLIRVEAASA